MNSDPRPNITTSDTEMQHSQEDDALTITYVNSLPVVLTPKEQAPLKVVLISFVAIAFTVLALVFNNLWLGLVGAIATIVFSLKLLTSLGKIVMEELTDRRDTYLGGLGMVVAIAALGRFLDLGSYLASLASQIDWNIAGSLAEWIGAVGQILIAVLALALAWRQYIISRDLTIQQNALTVQQNLITQQQTIDTYFQGISDLVLDGEGLLEDWPQERLLAEGRTAAILGSIDANGKAKVIRFLSRSKLLTPLLRDSRLGRAIFDGNGSYAEDRATGVRVIMLAGADLSYSDLRWTDLSDANLIRADLRGCDLVRANLSRTILQEADLTGADVKGVRLFYGEVDQASPRSRTSPPDYQTGAFTGAVVENVDFSEVKEMSESQRQYCCAWCGEKSRSTIPGGCQDIPNKLGR
jgi:uncharacterized protein YjbI with pentapeptide repeats